MYESCEFYKMATAIINEEDGGNAGAPSPRGQGGVHSYDISGKHPTVDETAAIGMLQDAIQHIQNAENDFGNNDNKAANINIARALLFIGESSQHLLIPKKNAM